MSTLLLKSNDCDNLLDWRGLREYLSEAHRALSRGDAVQPVPRRMHDLHESSRDRPEVISMTALLGTTHLTVVKSLVDAPGQRKLGLPAQRSTVCLFSSSTGECLAVIDGAAITRLRTAAVTALAVEALSSPDSNTLGFVGAGRLAFQHVNALSTLRPFASLKAWSPSGTSAIRLAEYAQSHGIEASVTPTAQDTLTQSVVCTLTPATEPILHGNDVHPGQLINAIGSPPRPYFRELDGSLLQRADNIVVDAQAIATSDSGNVVQAINGGYISADDLVELGDVLSNPASIHGSDESVTVFCSTGIGLQDLAAAAFFVDRAQQQHRGVVVDLLE